MKKITLCLLAVCAIIFGKKSIAQYEGQPPAHVIVVMEENYAYSKIIGSSLAPTFTALAKDTFCANMTLATAITHPSEPNYLDLFSGNEQGITVDESGPPASPLNDCNLGSSIIQAGYTFIGYAEDQPSPGWYQGDAGNYYTKHCPWINWIGYGVPSPYDSIPLKSDLPFAPIGTYFPDSNHYSSLPTMSWVIPNSIDDMHDGSATSAIPNGDTWFKTNMMPLVRWAANPVNNAVIFVIWDEDDYSSTNPSNHIPVLICGGIVKGGNYNSAINHYSLLRCWEEMYGLQYCGSSATASEVPSAIWRAAVGINTINGVNDGINIWPVPAKNIVNISVNTNNICDASVKMYDITGKMIKQQPASLKPGNNTVVLGTEDIANGVYLVKVIGDNMNVSQKIVINK